MQPVQRQFKRATHLEQPPIHADADTMPLAEIQQTLMQRLTERAVPKLILGHEEHYQYVSHTHL
jgi:hypothetical protein